MTKNYQISIIHIFIAAIPYGKANAFCPVEKLVSQLQVGESAASGLGPSRPFQLQTYSPSVFFF